MFPRKTLFLFMMVWLPGRAQGQMLTEYIWQNTLGSYYTDVLTDVIPLEDGRLLACGHSNSIMGFDKSETAINCCYYDYWILMLDSAGNKLWDAVYGGTDQEYLASAIHMSDGGSLLAGYSTSGVGYDRTEPGMGSFDYWLVRIDAEGNVMWDEALGGNSGDELTHALMTADQEILLVGYSSSAAGFDKDENPKGGVSDHDYWIVLTDTLGEVIWENTIGGNRYDEAAGAVQTADGGFLIVGSSASGVSADKSEPFHGEPGPPTYDYWLVKLDAGGNVQWDKTIGGGEDDIPTGILDCGDDTYLLFGYSFSPAGYDKTENHRGSEDYWLVHVDASGNILWDKTFGVNSADVATCATRIADDQYLVGGWSYSNVGFEKTEAGHGGKDIWLVAIDSSGQFLWEDGIGCAEDDATAVLYAYPDSTIIVAGHSDSDTCADKLELNKSTGDDKPDYFLFRLQPYELTQMFGSDGGCVGETYLLPWGEETDTFGVFVDTIHGDVIDTLYTFDLHPVVINDSIFSMTYYLQVYDCVEGADYTWIDCATGEQVDWYPTCDLWVTQDGYYAVIIEKEGCIDTSECLFLEGWINIENIYFPDLQVFPNPGAGYLQISGAPVGAHIDIRNVYGQLVYSNVSERSEISIDITDNMQGVYHILINYMGQHAELRYVKMQ